MVSRERKASTAGESGNTGRVHGGGLAPELLPHALSQGERRGPVSSSPDWSRPRRSITRSSSARPRSSSYWVW